MTRRTKEAVKKDVITVQKCTERISADVLSLKDLAEKLNLTKNQLIYTFERMENETSKRIQFRLKYLNQRAKQIKNYRTLNFPTKTTLGYNEKRTKAIFVDPSTLNTVLEEGAFTPKRNDIIYVVEHYDGKIFFKKSLVLSVSVKRNCLMVNVLELINQKFSDNKSVSEIANSNDIGIFEGIDSYVLSKI